MRDIEECQNLRMDAEEVRVREHHGLYPSLQFLLAVAALLSALSHASPARSSNSPNRFTVVDSGAWLYDNSPFVWLDNQRIAFVTSESMRVDFTRKARAIWSPGTRPVVDWHHVEALWCFDGTNLGFQQRVGAKKSWFIGPVGQETPWEFSACRFSGREFRRPGLSGGNCGCLDNIAAPWSTRRSEPLMAGHGWIDLGADRGTNADRENVPVYYQRETGSPVLMPFGSRQVGPITYHPFKGAYFIQGAFYNPEMKIQQSPWPRDLPQLAWWLVPNKDAVQVSIPVTAAQKMKRAYWESPTPTQRGMAVIASGGRISNTSSGEDGLYLINGNQVEKLLDGYVSSIGVSPDGCRLGVASAPYANAAWDPLHHREFPTLKVIDLCKSGEGK